MLRLTGQQGSSYLYRSTHVTVGMGAGKQLVCIFIGMICTLRLGWSVCSILLFSGVTLFGPAKLNSPYVAFLPVHQVWGISCNSSYLSLTGIGN